MPQGITKYIIIITVILLVVVLSQQPFFRQLGRNAVAKTAQPVQEIMTKGSSWVNGTVAPKISGEVQKRGEIIKNEVSEEKKNISENILEKTKNYFSGIANSIIRPGTPQNCQPTQTSAQTQPKP